MVEEEIHMITGETLIEEEPLPEILDIRGDQEEVDIMMMTLTMELGHLMEEVHLDHLVVEALDHQTLLEEDHQDHQVHLEEEDHLDHLEDKVHQA